MVRADLDSPALAGLRDVTVKRCTGIPRPWPVKDLTQAETEKLIVQDRTDSLRCASSSLSYVKTVSARDKALTGKK